MRTTLSIDDDILKVAKSIARDSKRSVGEVISGMARRGLASQHYSQDELGLPVFEVSEDAPRFGPDDVAEGEDDL